MARPEDARSGERAKGDPPGRLGVVGRSVEEARATADIALAAARRGPRHGEFVDLLGVRAYFKHSALVGKTRLRYALKRGILRRRLPRLKEYDNLGWLRDRGFRAPEPLAAGALWRGGLPRFQFLLTRAVADSVTLAQFLAATSDREARARVLDELARETARMHALGFVHHDLFPRNLLVSRAGGTAAPVRLWFLDCWAGGPPKSIWGPPTSIGGPPTSIWGPPTSNWGPLPQARGPAYDLACLMLDGTLAPDERERFLEIHAAESAARGRPVAESEHRRALDRERARLERRSALKPGSGSRERR